MNNLSNYPAGAENDPNAPYNQPDVEYVVCPDCEGRGYNRVNITISKDFIFNLDLCETCEGDGKVPRTFEDDLADEETAAEEKGDRIRNER